MKMHTLCFDFSQQAPVAEYVDIVFVQLMHALSACVLTQRMSDWLTFSSTPAFNKALIKVPVGSASLAINRSL